MMSRYDLMAHDERPLSPLSFGRKKHEFSRIRLSVYQLFKPEAATAAQKPHIDTVLLH